MGCLFTGIFSFIFAILGYFISDWHGAFIGFLIGTLLDFIFGKNRIRVNKHYYKSQDFTEHELVLAAYVAKADNNRLLRSEMEYVRQFLAKTMSSEQLSSAMLRFRDILNSDIDIQSVCADLRQHATIYEKLVILQFLFGFSNADGSMRQEELNAIQYISDLLRRQQLYRVRRYLTGGYTIYTVLF